MTDNLKMKFILIFFSTKLIDPMKYVYFICPVKYFWLLPVKYKLYFYSQIIIFWNRSTYLYISGSPTT